MVYSELKIFLTLIQASFCVYILDLYLVDQINSDRSSMSAQAGIQFHFQFTHVFQ